VTLFGTGWAVAMGFADRAFTDGMQTDHAELRETKLREALDTDPWFWRAHYELARTLSAVGRFRGAAEEGRATLRLRPHHVDALNHAAVCLIQAEGDEKEAEAWLLRAIEIAPFYYKSYYNLGLLERRRGRGVEARRLLTQSIDHNGRHASSYYCRGAVILSGGGSTEALEDLRKAREYGFDVGAALRMEYPVTLTEPKFAEFFR
jgi:tetratricopeptide (TPR) repeat protein